MTPFFHGAYPAGFSGVAAKLRRKALATVVLVPVLLAGCSQVDVPSSRNVYIPTPTTADDRAEAVNEKPDSVLYLPLGQDVLVPEVSPDDSLPHVDVGPFELRSETLAGALQLILADYEVPLAFESEEGLTRTITVANLRGPLDRVINRVCGLANMYCSYEDGLLIVKEFQTFTVKIPPISQDDSFMQNVATGLQAIIGTTPIIDASTRTIIYSATNRTAAMAERYFQRMRTSTALIVFETYIWEVSLNNGNSAGIRWSAIDTFGKFASNISLTGGVGADFSNPISIGLPTTQGASGGPFAPSDVLNFLSTFGAVKTISQPQITVLSGSQARLRAADTQNYVARIAETIDDGRSTTSVETSSVDTGFTITINSAWDNSTVYADIEIELTNVSSIDDFNFTTAGDDNSTSNRGSTRVQLPSTTEREVATQVRIRPGDSLLIAGLVRENDNFDKRGLGAKFPILPDSRTATANNLELVFLLRPRVVVFGSPSESQHFNAIKGEDIPEAATGVADVGLNTVEPAPHIIHADGTETPPAKAHTAAAPASAQKPVDAPPPAAVIEPAQEPLQERPTQPTPTGRIIIEPTVPVEPEPLTQAPAPSAVQTELAQPVPLENPSADSAPTTLTTAPANVSAEPLPKASAAPKPSVSSSALLAEPRNPLPVAVSRTTRQAVSNESSQSGADSSYNNGTATTVTTGGAGLQGSISAEDINPRYNTNQ